MIGRMHIRDDEAADLSDRQRRIYAFLHSHHTGVLSTVTPDNNPHGSVIYYAIGTDFKVRILTKTGTRKYNNLDHNDRAMLTVYDPSTQTTVELTGVAIEQSSAHEVNMAATAIFGYRPPAGDAMPPIVRLQAGPFTSFEIEPIDIRMATYAHHAPGGYDELFESIESFEMNNES